MDRLHPMFRRAPVLAALIVSGAVHADNLYWDGGTTDITADGNGASAGGNGTWDTTIKNWDTGAAPYVAWNNSNGDTAIFAGSAGTITVATSISTGGLTARMNNATATNIEIAGSNTLTVNGDLWVGANQTNSTPTKLNLTGATGTLDVNNPDGTLRVGSTSNTSAALFDMSALGTFTTDLGATGKVVVGTETTFNSSAAGQDSTLTLAPDSTITAGTLEMGTKQRVATAVSNTLNLGTGINQLNIDRIDMGPNQNSGSNNRGTTATLQFLNSNGTVTLRGAAGGTSRANLNVGNVSGSFSNITAIADFTGHDSDLLVDALTIGKYTAPSASSGSWFSTGTMSFDTGTLDANSVVVGIDSGSNGVATGTLNIGGGITNIGSGGITIGGSAGGTGTLDFTGGTITMGGAITKVGASTAATLTLNGATLDMGGNDIGGATAIHNLNLLSGTLKNVGEINGGATGLTKTGSGTLTIDGTNTFTGITTVSEGTLQLTATGSIGASSEIVLAGGTFDISAVVGDFPAIQLSGTGTVAGSLTVTGELSPGTNGSGTLTVDGNFTQTSTGTLRFEPQVATTSPLLAVSGTAHLDGTLVVTLANGYVPTADDTLVVLMANTALTGSFTDIQLPALPEGLGWNVLTTANALSLEVVAVIPTLGVTPAAHDFGGVLTGATAQTTFVLTNTGTTPMTGTATVSGVPFTIISGGTYSLDPGESADVVVEFAPTEVAAFSDGLVLISSGGNTIYPLSGSGIIPAQLSAGPTFIDLGGVLPDTTAQATFVVTNNGGLPLIGTASVGAPFSVVNGASYSVNPGESTNVVVKFNAAAGAGAFSDVVTFTSNGGNTSRMVTARSLTKLPEVSADRSTAYSFNALSVMPAVTPMPYTTGTKYLAPQATITQTFIPRADDFISALNGQEGNASSQFAVSSLSLKLNAYQSSPATFNLAISRVEADGSRTLFAGQNFQQTIFSTVVRTWTFSEPILLSCDTQYELAITLVEGGLNVYGSGRGGVGIFISAEDYPDGACSAGGDLWFALNGTTTVPVYDGLMVTAEASNTYYFDDGLQADSTSQNNLKGKLLGVNGHPEQLNFSCPESWPPLTFSVENPALATLQTQGSEGNYSVTLNGAAEGTTYLFAKAGGTVVGYMKLQSYPQRSMKLSYSYVEYPGESDHALKQASAAIMAYISSVYAKANVNIQWTDHGILTHEWDANGDGNSYTDDFSEMWSPLTAQVIPNQKTVFSNVFMIRSNKDDSYFGSSNGGGTSLGYGLPSYPARGAMVRAHLFRSAQSCASTLAHELGHNLGLAHTGNGTAPLDNLMDVGRAGDSLWSWQWQTIHNTLGELFDVPPVVALTAPGDGAVFAQPDTLNLAATIVQNRNPITKVEFFADGGKLLGTATTAPYTYAWDNSALGNHTLTAVVTDNQGMIAISEAVNIMVGDTYAVWSEVISDPALRGPDEDPDHDGMKNLIEFATGTNPTTSNPSPITRAVVTDSGNEYLQLTVPRSPDASGYSFVIEFTTDFQTWTPGVVIENDSVFTARDTVPIGTTPGRRFGRLSVSAP